MVADFDRDGEPDFLGGRSNENRIVSFLWASKTGYQPTQTDIHAVDYEVGDIDEDGYPDVVAQMNEFISDFPSYTEVWLGGPDGFRKVQTLYNHDNHTDNAALVDVDGDRCLDYLMIGVDEPFIGLRRGDCHFLGKHDPTQPVDVGFETIPSVYGQLGAQCLDVNGDGACERWCERSVGRSASSAFLRSQRSSGRGWS